MGRFEQFADLRNFALGDGVVDLALEALALYDVGQVSLHGCL